MSKRTSKIGLGTVQWGMSYGVSNSDGQVPPEEVELILAAARTVGIRVVDTAALYGQAEIVLGENNLEGLHLITKTPSYAHTPITGQDATNLVSIFGRSLNRLHVSSVYGLLVHHVDNLLMPGGELLVEALESLRDSGLTQLIGVSVYDSEQIISLLDRFKPDIIQIPLNVFDQRLIEDGTLAWLASLGVQIHARSVFLQGLLLMKAEDLPDYFRQWETDISAWRLAGFENTVQPQHAALACVCDQPEIDCCLVGVQSANQLTDLLGSIESSPVFEMSSFSVSNRALLNPSNWQLEQ